MTKEQKLYFFQQEIDLIQTEDLKQFLIVAVSNMFDYVFIKEGSSSGKYHPLSDLGLGGLMRHKKGGFYIAYDLLSLEMYNIYTQREKDIMLVAFLLHDSWKYDDPNIKERKFTVANHPILASNWVRTATIFNNIISDEDRELIANCIASHSGQWNTDKNGNEILPKPKTKMQKFVHMCDYIASRRYLNFDLGVLNTNIVEPTEAKDYILSFGKKHKNKSIEQIYLEDYDYLLWAKDNMQMEPAHSYICKFLRQQKAKNITIEDIVNI